MELIRPSGLTAATFDRALAGLRSIVGDQWVFATDTDRNAYADTYAMGDGREHAPSLAVAPASVEEVQAIVRLANEHKLPIWPISRGKNLGYGGSAPAMPGTAVVDLGRLNRIIDVDPTLGVAQIEPGVGFFDLHRHLTENKIPLWMSLPGNAWGSVIGNALDRGFAASPYGEHVENLCGMEVVLPDGSLVRTGTGAMSNSKTWPLFKYGLGPAWDPLFAQSGLGVVTRAGYWLMPEPEAMAVMTLPLARPEDVGWLVDALTPLRLRGIIGSNVAVASYLASATTRTQRSEWYGGEGAIPDSVAEEICKRYGVGWWNVTVRLHGLSETVEAHIRAVQAAVAPHTQTPFTVKRWERGQPAADGAGPPSPSVFALQIVNWHGGRGGHIGFSPALPASGKLIVEQLQRTRARFAEFGIDYSGTFYLAGRHSINVNLMLFNRDDEAMTTRVKGLFSALIADSAAEGYSEYRTHLSYMQEVADCFDYNDGALARLNGTLKTALDPNGIMSPGKSGIWSGKAQGGKTA